MLKKKLTKMEKRPDCNFFNWVTIETGSKNSERISYACTLFLLKELYNLTAKIKEEYEKRVQQPHAPSDLQDAHQRFYSERNYLKKIEKGKELLGFFKDYKGFVASFMLSDITNMLNDERANIENGKKANLLTVQTKFSDETIRKLLSGRQRIQPHHIEVFTRGVLIPYYQEHPDSFHSFLDQMRNGMYFDIDYKLGTSLFIPEDSLSKLIADVDLYISRNGYEIKEEEFVSLMKGLFAKLTNLSNLINTYHDPDDTLIYNKVKSTCEKIDEFKNIQTLASTNTSGVSKEFIYEIISFIAERIKRSFKFAKTMENLTWDEYTKSPGYYAYFRWLLYYMIIKSDYTDILSCDNFKTKLSEIYNSCGVYLDLTAKIEPDVYLIENLWIGEDVVINNGARLSFLKIENIESQTVIGGFKWSKGSGP